MRLSDFSDYSLRVLMYLALLHPKQATVQEISQAYGISRHHLVKVVHHLGKLGYLATRRGVGGGFNLALDPAALGIGLLVRRTEKSLDLVECFSKEENRCRLNGACRLKGVLKEGQEAFFKVLDGYSLQDLVRSPAPMKAALGL